MNSGSYDLVSAEAGNKKEVKAEGEDSPLLEMSIQGTCILKEIVEGEEEIPKDSEKTEGGDEAKEVSDEAKEEGETEAPGSAAEGISDEDSGQEDEDKDVEEAKQPTEVAKENGGEVLSKKDYVGINVGQNGQKSPRNRNQRCDVPKKYLWVIIGILALIIIFMAIAWPRGQNKTEPDVPKATESSLTGASPIAGVTRATTPGGITEATTPVGVTTASPIGGVTAPSSGDDETLPTTQNPTTETTQKPTDSPTQIPEKMKSRLCPHQSCRSLAPRMLAYMNSDADPCDDFYSYACGGLTADGSQWISEPDPESRTWKRIYDSMMKEDSEGVPHGILVFKDFYTSCTKYTENYNLENRTEEARRALQEVGIFYKNAEWNETNYTQENFTQLIADLLIRQSNHLMEVKLTVDSRNASKFAWLVTAPSHDNWFTHSTWRDSQSECKKRVQATKMEGPNSLKNKYKVYKSCMENQVKQHIKEMGNALKKLGVDTAAIKWSETADKLEELLEELQKMLLRNGYRSTVREKAGLQIFALNNITNDLPQVDWRLLTEKLAGKYEHDDDMEVQVYSETFISHWLNTLTNYWSARDLNNYLLAMYASDIYHNFVAFPECSQEDQCLKQAVNLMPEAASALFLQSFTDKQLSAFEGKINEIFSKIIEMLEDELRLKNNDTETATSERLDIGLLADGGRSLFRDDAYLKGLYTQSYRNSSYLEEAVKLQMMHQKKLYQSKNKNPSDPEQIWLHFLRPYSTKGQAIADLNKVVVPYGLMQMPFFEENYPEPIQMARLGHVIAKEIWQILKKKGISQSKVTGMSEALQQCMSGMNNGNKSKLRLGKPLILRSDLNFIETVKGPIDMSEQLDDRMAACLAYRSIWKNNSDENIQILPWIEESPESTFFLAMAQTSCTKSSENDEALSILIDQHVPPRMRLNYIVRNLTEFMTAFNCPQTSQTLTADEEEQEMTTTLRPSPQEN
ncbi:endothelin-converting enzyme homolog [Ischnura elegans]|uniref:endothelin-converting enzyme homolog n=1 Tax=Ischnura elegans TaxID=197161 RepID=UPI001ED87CDC|nr:endothelin-converting enzyme homolog [Ischnura elegans]